MNTNEQYYIDTIRIDEWLVDNMTDRHSVIRYHDRIEFYLGDKLHNDEDAAVMWHDANMPKRYYLHGILYEDMEKWNQEARVLLRYRKTKDLMDD